MAQAASGWSVVTVGEESEIMSSYLTSTHSREDIISRV